MNRRSFISSAASLAGILGAKGLRAAAPRPALRARFGVLSDVHITTDAGSCDLFEHALRTFDKRKCDGVLLCGDIADYGLADELKAAGDTWFKVFPDGKRSDGEPVEPLFIYGDHDMGGYMHTRVASKNQPEKCIPLTDPAAAWEAAFREKWQPVQVKKVKGYTFILAHHPAHSEASEFGQKIPGIEEALAAHAPKGKLPFFYLQHRIVKDTCAGPWAWGQENGASRAALDAYPNAVVFCGHGHQEAQDEACIWQDAFTAIEVPSLRFVGIRPGRENSRGHDDIPSKMMPMVNTGGGKQGMLMEVFDDRIVIERRDFTYDCEVAEPWTVPLPFPSGKPYNHALRASREVAPQFPEAASVRVRQRGAKDRAGAEHKAFDVEFDPAPAGAGTPRAFDYEVTAEMRQGDVVRVLRQKRVFSYNGHFPESRDTRLVACVFSRGELSAQAEAFRFSVRPCGPFGAKGRAIRSAWVK